MADEGFQEPAATGGAPADSVGGESADASARGHPAALALAGAVEALCRIDTADLDGPGLERLLADLDTAGRRLAAVRGRVLASLERNGKWATDGNRSFPAWLQRSSGSSAGEAWRATRTARALQDHLPATAAALADGHITAEHAQLMAAHTTKTPERLAALGHPAIGEAFLVDQATKHDASGFARLVRAWAVAADPAGADGQQADDLDRQELVLAKALHGFYIQGWLDDVDGAALEAALDALTGVPDGADARTTPQRRAAALVALARLALDGGHVSPGSAIRPHLNVHVPHETFTALVAAQAADQAAAPAPAARRDAGEPFAGPGRFAWPTVAPTHPDTPRPGDPIDTRPDSPVTIPGSLAYPMLIGATPAELDDGTPLSPVALARLACDGELARVVFGSSSEVLDVGRAQRLFTPGQRRGVIARDRTCRFPGCDAPPGLGEIHHSLWWYAHHGPTSTDNAVLLCWFHHAYVHNHRITITHCPATGDAPERWTFTRPGGVQVLAAGPRKGWRNARTGSGGSEDGPRREGVDRADRGVSGGRCPSGPPDDP